MAYSPCLKYHPWGYTSFRRPLKRYRKTSHTVTADVYTLKEFCGVQPDMTSASVRSRRRVCVCSQDHPALFEPSTHQVSCTAVGPAAGAGAISHEPRDLGWSPTRPKTRSPERVASRSLKWRSGCSPTGAYTTWTAVTFPEASAWQTTRCSTPASEVISRPRGAT
eukprot:scaffold133101_cov63-Phaeocystis_antarctica.AAC.2